MTRTSLAMPSPVGNLLIVAENERITRIASGADGASHQSADCGSQSVLIEARGQLEGYFAGELREFELPLDLRGTPFQVRVWRGLLEIGYGQTVSYGDLARHVGSPRGSRAVGMANSRNPVSIVVPCHRCIGADGSLTGYAGGLGMKSALLALESRN